MMSALLQESTNGGDGSRALLLQHFHGNGLQPATRTYADQQQRYGNSYHNSNNNNNNNIYNDNSNNNHAHIDNKELVVAYYGSMSTGADAGVSAIDDDGGGGAEVNALTYGSNNADIVNGASDNGITLRTAIVSAGMSNATITGGGGGGGIGDSSSNNNNIDVTELSQSNLDEINQSVELQCLLQEHIETTTFGNASDYCLTQFDTILCWPRTPRGTLAVLPCLDEFQGIQYDSSQNATRYCHTNGSWEKYTNYDACMHLPVPSNIPEFETIIELPTIIYYIGYAISFVSLTLAVIVFVYFKELRCLRNSIHANLFFTYIMSALLWILTLSLQMSMRTGLAGCIVLVIFFHFFTLTNFFWMLVEGLYLYMLVVKTFSGDNIRFNMYAVIGWGGPAVFVVAWTIAKGLTLSYASEQIDIGCPWMQETTVDWIFQGPVCVVLIMNLIFLLRIMWVLITKLRSANTVETRQYRKAAKALLVLIPLFGITYLVVLAGPTEEGVMSHMFAVVRAVLLSTQGFSVSLFYCFLNSEVRSTLRHHISRWQDERNIQLNQSRRYTSKSFSKDNALRPETARKGKRESCVSSATTTTLLGQNNPHMLTLQRGSNGALHMLSTATALTMMPRAVSPLMKQGLEENSV